MPVLGITGADPAGFWLDGFTEANLTVFFVRSSGSQLPGFWLPRPAGVRFTGRTGTVRANRVRGSVLPAPDDA